MSHRSRTRLSAAFAVVLLGWAVCTAAQLEKYLGIRFGLVATCLGATFVAVALLWLRRALRQHRIAPWAAWCVLGLLFVAFGAIYPKARHHLPGRGSDREDALRVEAVALIHHEYPYDARTFLGNPPTPLPGAVYLAMPFFAIGWIALQNLFWAFLFTLFLRKFLQTDLTAALFLGVFVLLALENLNDFVVGGDYTVNALYVAIAVALISLAVQRQLLPWQTSLAVCFLGLALSSRPIYVLTLPALLCYGFRQHAGRRTVVLLGLSVTVSAICTLPVFIPHPVTHLAAQFAQNSSKMVLPEYVPTWLLPGVAVAVSCAGLGMHRLDLSRTFGLIGAALLVLILPSMLGIQREHGGWAHMLTTDFEYFAAPVIFLGLWALATWERAALSDASLIQTQA